MGIFPAGRSVRRYRRVLIALILGGAAVFAAAHVRAWYHYRAAQYSLARYHFAEARDHLAIALGAWPGSGDVHLLAARAARLDGAFTEAKQHLRICQQAQPSDPKALQEWTLLRAQIGELEPVENYLRDLLRQGAEQSPPLIQEALIEGYIRTYRLGPAKAGIDDWLQRQPDDTQALCLQGCLWQQVQKPQKALASYRRVVELDPQRDDARRRLTQCLLRLGLYEEANPHLEYLLRRYPQNAEITVELAGARFKQGQVSESRQLLDAVLAQHPDNEAALRERGRLALADGNAAQAEKWLRQAEKLNPYDAKLLPLLSSALEHQGKQDEAHVLQERLKQTDHDFLRLEQICLHDLGERPNDPLLHSELGALLLRLGYRETGRNWLLLALREDPNCAPAHAALQDANLHDLAR
jgi:tetratricopeptide (TPR) repeat protein